MECGLSSTGLVGAGQTDQLGGTSSTCGAYFWSSVLDMLVVALLKDTPPRNVIFRHLSTLLRTTRVTSLFEQHKGLNLCLKSLGHDLSILDRTRAQDIELDLSLCHSLFHRNSCAANVSPTVNAFSSIFGQRKCFILHGRQSSPHFRHFPWTWILYQLHSPGASFHTNNFLCHFFCTELTQT